LRKSPETLNQINFSFLWQEPVVGNRTANLSTLNAEMDKRPEAKVGKRQLKSDKIRQSNSLLKCGSNKEM
jgi:hypothetical protein